MGAGAGWVKLGKEEDGEDRELLLVEDGADFESMSMTASNLRVSR